MNLHGYAYLLLEYIEQLTRNATSTPNTHKTLRMSIRLVYPSTSPLGMGVRDVRFMEDPGRRFL
eukprot:5035903-Ditylum_brightwellii.AAC.1